MVSPIVDIIIIFQKPEDRYSAHPDLLDGPTTRIYGRITRVFNKSTGRAAVIWDDGEIYRNVALTDLTFVISTIEADTKLKQARYVTENIRIPFEMTKFTPVETECHICKGPLETKQKQKRGISIR